MVEVILFLVSSPPHILKDCGVILNQKLNLLSYYSFFNFISFLRESEFRIKNSKKNYDELLQEFFNCYDCTKNLENTIISDDHTFLDDIDFYENSSNDEDDSSSD